MSKNPTYLGKKRSLALFLGQGKAVLVNTKTLVASVHSLESIRAEHNIDGWDTSSNPDSVWGEIASASLKREFAPSNLSMTASVKRTYTVPKRVAESAASSFLTEGVQSPTATLIASVLCSGDQIACEDVLWVSRFFENHTSDSTDRATWLSWGGEEGKRWSEAFASRLDYDSVIADAGTYETPGVQDFVDGNEDDRSFWVELNEPYGQYANSLYKLTDTGTWQAWGNGDWFDCDEPQQTPEFISLDDEAALFVAGALFDAPDSPVDLRTPNPEAWDLACAARDEIDWTLVDRVMVAAAPPGSNPTIAEAVKTHNAAPASTPVPTQAANDYTPEERSANAKNQLRDANGRFAEVGAQGAIKSTGMSGTITKADTSTGEVTIKGDDGNVYTVSAKDFEVGAAAHPKADPNIAIQNKLDFTGILAPIHVKIPPKASLPQPATPLSPTEINQTLDGYSNQITKERQNNSKNFKKLLENSGTIAEHLNPETPITAAAGDSTPVDASSDIPPPSVNPTPDETDVQPIYLALVDQDDPQAVTDLVALVPATATSSEPHTFRRAGGKWVEDPSILLDLKSATPPPTVQLDADQYKDVLSQVDGSTATSAAPTGSDASQTITADALPAYPQDQDLEQPYQVVNPQEGDTMTCPMCGEQLTYDPLDGFQGADGSVGCDEGVHSDHYEVVIVAAGGLDRNRGNAETLRHYWDVGPGGAQIRWNTGGDWTRCVRLLSKHLGPRAKGYCALRHKEMTGMWPGDKANRRQLSVSSITAGATPIYSDDVLLTEAAVLRASAVAAAREVAIQRVRGEFNYSPVPVSADDVTEGRSGRQFCIPLAIPEGIPTGDGRTFAKGSLGMRTLPLPLLWQIQSGEGHDGSVLVGRIDRIERVDSGLGNAYGVFDTGPYGQEAQRLVESNMLRWVSADLDKFEIDESKSDPETGVMFIKKGRFMGATLVPKPAFQECTIKLLPLEENEMPQDAQPSAISASASIANAIPVEPPSLWFDRPLLNGVTPITVTDDGQVFGHIATWNMDHIGMAGQTRPPRSASGYAYFHTGVLRTAEGQDVKVGQLTLAGGHAPLNYDANLAVRHYDDTASAIADVHAGEDRFGIWVAGALRPGATAEQIRALRASAPSGDWRAINRRLELVAVCQVNVPGFPVPRSLAASGAVTSLVAAGVAPIIEIREHQTAEDEAALVAAARERIFAALDIEGYMTEFKTFDAETRKKLAQEGKALPDGSFPIENVQDLRRAVHAYGRADDSKKAQVRRHIIKRARGLGKPNMIPSSWTEASLTDIQIDNRNRYDNMVASARSAKVDELRMRVNPQIREELSSKAAELRERINKKD